MERTIGEIPESMHGSLVAATDSCVAIGTLNSSDGQSRITLSDEGPVAKENETPIFEGVLDTPARKIAVCTVGGQPVLELNVGETRTRVKIWANDPVEPDEIDIFVSHLEFGP